MQKDDTRVRHSNSDFGGLQVLRRTINRSLSRTNVLARIALLVLLSLSLDNKSKPLDFEPLLYFFFLLQIVVSALSSLRSTPRDDNGGSSSVEEDVRRASRSTLYRWSHPDANRETTRGSPGLVVGLIPSAGLDDFTEQRTRSLSHPRRRQRTQPLPLPPPHVAAPSPDKVSICQDTLSTHF